MNEYNLTEWQKVILINYGTVPNRNIASVINVKVESVIESAIKLGLSKIRFNKDWQEKGFVTIIRNNWDLLSLDEICVLLGISRVELDTILKEYDFLDVKLGEKPITKSVKYYELSEEQEIYTKSIKKFLSKKYLKATVKPFDFFKDYNKGYFQKSENAKIQERFTSSYCARYSGALLDEDLSDYTEEYLEKLVAVGINGIWLSDTLRNLAKFPFDERLSVNYKIRVNNLRKLTERCKKYGINVYLYLNEPRSLPEEFFVKYPHLKGQLADDGTHCLCTSNKEVLEYLYFSVKSIAENVPLLKGIMTITMSENPTHCYARRWGDSKFLHTECPNCSKRKIEEIVADINNTINRALKDGNGNTKLIANMWAWEDFCEVSESDAIHKCIDLLDKDIELMCVSETRKEFVRGGINSIVDDYSISVVGPSEYTVKTLKYAKEKGHNIWAKVQFNNSWECSAVPYIPVFDLMEEHLNNIKALGVNSLMAGWSLGGYPGGALSLLNMHCEHDNFNSDLWYEKVYGKDYSIIKKAVSQFSDAFRNFPFSLESLYFGGHNLGPANIWSLNKQNRSSTMVCFSFDDISLVHISFLHSFLLFSRAFFSLDNFRVPIF